MEVLISKTKPLEGVQLIQIFHPADNTPKTYLFVIDGNIFSYRKIDGMIFIAGEDMTSFNTDIIGVIKRLIQKANNPRKAK